MQAVYSAANIIDAHLAKGLLAQAGIGAYVRGENLQGGIGDIPVHGLMDVCVDETDVDRAEAVITDWQAGAYALDDDAPVQSSPGDPSL